VGAKVTFLVTAADELPFADDSFDAVICRNLTWALPHPEETFLQWQRVLCPGGRLIYQDANHYYYMYNEEDRKNRERYAVVSGSHHGPEGANYDTSLCDETAKDLPMSRLDRPREWDELVLPKLGFEILAEEIYHPQALLKYGLYEASQGFYTWFLIAAINGKAE
jgi:SAM-dependent methyltransferase